MATARHKRVARALLRNFPQTFAAQAGITLRDKPSPLFRLLVLSSLLSARISSDIAVAAARELSRAGYRTPQRMVEATWQQRVDALGRGHYRRYDERTATMLGEAAQLVLDRYSGDLRQLHEQSRGREDVEKRLQEFTSIGPTGAAIFCREVQGVWQDLSPYADKLVGKGADRLNLPDDPDELAALVKRDELPVLVAGLVRVGLDHKLADALEQHG